MQETRVWFLSQEDPLERGVSTHTINPMDRGAWQAAVHGVAKESDRTKQLKNSKIHHFRAPVASVTTSICWLCPDLCRCKRQSPASGLDCISSCPGTSLMPRQETPHGNPLHSHTCGQEGRGVNKCGYEVPVVKGFTLLDLDGLFEMHFITLLGC